MYVSSCASLCSLFWTLCLWEWAVQNLLWMLLLGFWHLWAGVSRLWWPDFLLAMIIISFYVGGRICRVKVIIWMIYRKKWCACVSTCLKSETRQVSLKCPGRSEVSVHRRKISPGNNQKDEPLIQWVVQICESLSFYDCVNHGLVRCQPQWPFLISTGSRPQLACLHSGLIVSDSLHAI